MRRRPGSANPMACSGPGNATADGSSKISAVRFRAESSCGRFDDTAAVPSGLSASPDYRSNPHGGTMTRRTSMRKAGRPFAGKREPSACPAEATPTMVSDGGRSRSPDPSRSTARRSPNARGGSRWLQAHAHPRRWPHPAKNRVHRTPEHANLRTPAWISRIGGISVGEIPLTA